MTLFARRGPCDVLVSAKVRVWNRAAFRIRGPGEPWQNKAMRMTR